jgi:hypothetical protein
MRKMSPKMAESEKSTKNVAKIAVKVAPIEKTKYSLTSTFGQFTLKSELVLTKNRKIVRNF